MSGHTIFTDHSRQYKRRLRIWYIKFDLLNVFHSLAHLNRQLEPYLTRVLEEDSVILCQNISV